MSTEVETESDSSTEKRARLDWSQVIALAAWCRDIQAGTFETWSQASTFAETALGFKVATSSVKQALLACKRPTEGFLAVKPTSEETLAEKVAALQEVVKGLGEVIKSLASRVEALETPWAADIKTTSGA